MKILHVVLTLAKGGLEHLVVDLALRQLQNGNNVKICSLEAAPSSDLLVRNCNVPTVFLKRSEGKDWKLLWALIKFIYREAPDVVHAHNTVPLIYCAIAAKVLRGPIYVNTRHGDFVKHWPRFFLTSYARIIAVSRSSLATLIKHNAIKNFEVIHNGIDVNSYQVTCSRNDMIKASRAKLTSIPESASIVGIIARLSKEKDHQTLLKAFSIITGKFENIFLLVIGDGPERKNLFEFCTTLGIQREVIFLGFRNDIRDLLYALDVLVLSSLSEGLSLTLLEGMAASVPIISTSVGGNPGVVVDGETGFLVPPKDPQAMADAIIKILRDKDLARRMGEAGRKRVEEKFSLDRMVDEYVGVYEEVLRKKKVGPFAR